MSALILWSSIPLAVVAFGLWVSTPIWLVLHHPGQHSGKIPAGPAYAAATH